MAARWLRLLGLDDRGYRLFYGGFERLKVSRVVDEDDGRLPATRPELPHRALAGDSSQDMRNAEPVPLSATLYAQAERRANLDDQIAARRIVGAVKEGRVDANLIGRRYLLVHEGKDDGMDDGLVKAQALGIGENQGAELSSVHRSVRGEDARAEGFGELSGAEVKGAMGEPVGVDVTESHRLEDIGGPALPGAVAARKAYDRLHLMHVTPGVGGLDAYPKGHREFGRRLHLALDQGAGPFDRGLRRL